ncbi:hypothetical protein OTU49_009777, partial [Cherax quadricarinatus]
KMRKLILYVFLVLTFLLLWLTVWRLRGQVAEVGVAVEAAPHLLDDTYVRAYRSLLVAMYFLQVAFLAFPVVGIWLMWRQELEFKIAWLLAGLIVVVLVVFYVVVVSGYRVDMGRASCVGVCAEHVSDVGLIDNMEGRCSITGAYCLFLPHEGTCKVHDPNLVIVTDKLSLTNIYFPLLLILVFSSITMAIVLSKKFFVDYNPPDTMYYIYPTLIC